MALADKKFLIGIGAQKAGTSWLGDYFARHPDVYMCPIKEMHYFDARFVAKQDVHIANRMLDKFRRAAALLKDADALAEPRLVERAVAYAERLQLVNGDDADYLRYFERRVGEQKAFSEITPSYSLLNEEQFRHVHSLHPNVRFIFIIRNPVDRFWSAMRFIKKRRPGYDIDGEFDGYLGRAHPQHKSDYRVTIETLDRAVPAEHVHIEFYESLFSQEALEQLCRFCGIRFRKGRVEKRVGISKEEKLTEARRREMFERFRSTYAFAQQRFGARLPASWKADIDRFG